MKKRMMRADDLYKAQVISDNRMSPDKKYVVMSVMNAERAKEKGKDVEKKYSSLFMLDLKTGKTKQFTSGKHSDINPHWSTNSKYVYFLSNREDEKQFQIYSISVDGGEAEKLTEMKGEISDMSLSPDGKQIAFVFKENDERPEKDRCYHYTKTFFKADGEGYLDNKNYHIHLLNLKNRKVKQLTKENFDHLDITWTKDSKNIIFLSNRSADPHLEMWNYEFYMIKASGGSAKKIDAYTGIKGSPLVSPCGNFMAFLGIKTKTDGWKNLRIFIKELNTEKPPVCLNPRADYTVSNYTINDLAGHDGDTMKWSDDGKYIYFQASYHGSTNLRRINVNNRKDESVIDELGVVGNFAMKDSKVYHFMGTILNPGEIFEYDIDKKQIKQITEFNKWLKGVDLGGIERVFLKNGKSPLQGWIIKPPKFNSRKKYPSILEIHGGPHVQYGELFMHEFYYLAAQGYVVHFCNPKGSAGYSEKFTGSIKNNWGTVDYDDIMHWTDQMQKKSYIDGKRMGVTGGSYGGYMTNWIIGHTRRFKAAVTQRSVSNLYSMWGSSDYNWGFQHEFGTKPPFETPSNYLRQSPISFIKNAKTPTLVIHSLNDFRCAVEQGEQLYVALKYLRVDTELVLFPGEPHGLSRGGRTDRRIARLEHISRWFKKYL